MEGNAKQAVAEKLRSSSSVLVTVSNDPTVDQLASALGLSLMLTKLGKHTTTVFSGKMPNTMEFLDPDKTFDSTVDGLRDFIISLDKEKADKLRYKVEDDVVKVFITPYKSKITAEDLNFTQGDFNVDLVVALGVHKRDDLDTAITAHGRILHDATIVTINSGKGIEGNLGAIDWTDTNASCLAEMLVSISEALEGGILDKQMSTAFLTGIVAATERFKNEATTPKVMTMAAQLMAAGANQQLIATNLQIDPKKAEEKTESKKPDDKTSDDSGDDFAQEGTAIAIDRAEGDKKSSGQNDSQPKEDGYIETPVATSVKDAADLDDEDLLSDIESAVHAKHNKLNDEGRTEKIDGEDPAIKQLEDELSQDSSSSLIDLESKLKSYDPNNPAASEKPAPTAEAEDTKDDLIDHVKSSAASAVDPMDQPAMGGTFNATSAEAHDRNQQDREQSLNKGILSHGKTLDAPIHEDLNGVSTHGKDIPNSSDLLKDLEEARRAVDTAIDESQFNQPGMINPVSAALNAAPMPMDESGMNPMSMDFGAPAPQQMQQPQPMNPPQMQPPQMQQPFGPQQMQQPQPMSPPPMQPPQMQQQFPQQQQPQQPMSNPMFNQPPMQQMPQAGQQPMAPGMQQMPPQMDVQAPPPMPPSAPPPMPPFN